MIMKTDEQIRFAKKQSCFRDSAKIHFKHLKCENVAKEEQKLFLNPKNVVRLVQIYKLEGCLRLDIEHHVPTIVKKTELQKNLSISNVDGGDLFKRKTPSKLKFSNDVILICLHDRHRLEAIKKFLLFGDRWWIMNLYFECMRNDI